MNARQKELDGLRGIAVLLIIVWHYGNNLLYENTTTISHYIKISTSYTWSGVDLFFTLSGFLLGGILLKNRESKKYFSTFYIRRICRIFPIYFLTLIVVFLLIAPIIVGAHKWVTGPSIPSWSYFTFTQNIFMGLNETLGNRWLTHTWSLALEEQFYILLPVLIYFLNKRWLVIVLTIACISAPVFRYYSSNWYESFNFLHCRFDALFSGVLVAVVASNEKVKSFIQTKKNWFDLGIVIAILLTLLLTSAKIHIHYVLENTWFSVLFSFIMLVIVTRKDGFFAKILKLNLLARIGIISYGLYLYHPLVLGLMHYFILNQAPVLNNQLDVHVTILAFFVSLLIAFLSYRFIEKPIIEIGHRYNY